LLRRPKPPFTGNKLVSAGQFADDDRLQKSVCRKAFGKRPQFLGIEFLPRLMRIAIDFLDSQMDHACGRFRLAMLFARQSERLTGGMLEEIGGR
jgi:hypothetical protein